MKAFFITIGAAALVAATCGWIANIVKLASMDQLWPLTGEAILRIIGIFVAPIGVVMGIC